MVAIIVGRAVNGGFSRNKRLRLCLDYGFRNGTESETLINCPDPSPGRQARSGGPGLLAGCGPRRGEAVSLTLERFQQRDGRWVIVDLRGKHGRVRTIPVPAWVKLAVDLGLESNGDY